MARILLELQIPGWSADDLRRVIRDLDAADCGDEDAIDPVNVKAFHIFEAIMTDQLGLTDGDLSELIIGHMDATGMEVPLRPNPNTGYYRVTRDEIADA